MYFAPNNKSPKYIKQTLKELEGDRVLYNITDFNNPFLKITTIQKLNKETENLNNTINPLDLRDI